MEAKRDLRGSIPGCWEIPAGSVKPGQTQLEAALEELREKVGGAAERLDYVRQSDIADGICNKAVHFHLAKGVTLGPPAHEAGEV